MTKDMESKVQEVLDTNFSKYMLLKGIKSQLQQHMKSINDASSDASLLDKDDLSSSDFDSDMDFSSPDDLHLTTFTWNCAG